MLDVLDHLVAVNLNSDGSPAGNRFQDNVAILSGNFHFHVVSEEVVVALNIENALVGNGLRAAVGSSRFDVVAFDFVASNKYLNNLLGWLHICM